MSIAGIKVLIIGRKFDLPYEVLHLDSSAAVLGSIAKFHPDVIVTSEFQPGPLLQAHFDVRKRWIHVPAGSTPQAVSNAVESCYQANLWTEHPGQKANPLISVYTGTFNTGDYLKDAFQSLKEQTYKNWEWVVVDDASTDGTWERLVEYSNEDVRVRPHRNAKRCGKIGGVKDMATRLCQGTYLVELDHDDMLTDFALDEIRAAFEADPEAGLVYSNYSSFFENGTFHKFTDDFWKNRYRETEYHGKKWIEVIQPDIYDRFGPHFTQQFGYFLTFGPNHVRAFRARTFSELGGYNSDLPIADDFDLVARFFLKSKCVRLDKMLYLYRVRDAWSNTTFTRNKSIQDHLALVRARYAAEFEAYNAKRPATGVPVPVSPPPPAAAAGADEPCFVVASRSEADAQAVRSRLGGRDVFVKVGARSILEAYEEGRLRWAGRRRIVYVHDDVDFRDLDEFLRTLRELLPGTHGVCGSGAPDALERGPWWDCPPLFGKYVQAFPSGGGKTVEWPSAEIPSEVSWLDGVCLVTIDQEWSWKVEGDPVIWHGYDWLACKRTREAGGTCRTIAQPGAPILMHRGYGRMDGYAAALGVLRGTERLATAADVGFVVLDATGGPMAARCLRSIREHAPGAEIVLVANGVLPAKEALVFADKTVLLEANLGFAAGCNRGTMEVSRRLVCFMNDDAVFVDGTPGLLAAALSPRAMIVAPYSNRAKPPQGDIPLDVVPKVDVFPQAVVGLCMMMPTSLFRSLNGFDPRLNTWEDDDFCLRAARAGYHSKVVGGTWVYHERHATFRALGLDVNRIMRDNRALFMTMHPRIRVVVIAKDEEAAIGDFFEQFRPVTTDWCVLDTGSTDRTVELARAKGAKVESARLEDFAQARNEALKRFASGAEWIVMLDPDERLDPHTIAHLEETLARTSHDILLAPLVAVRADGGRRNFVPKPVAFRTGRGIRWIFKVHEKLVGSQKQAMIANATIEHLIVLHEDGRRARAEGFYKGLMEKEPYFTDPAYRARMREEWPILDYDRMDDPRIAKLHAGPLVSVVVPTWKRPELLRMALRSVLAQDYPNLEAVVVGDACPFLDGLTPTVELRNPRVRTLNLPANHGSGGAVPRNYALMLAAGGLIAYLDDDNDWSPDHLSSLYAALRGARGASFAFSSMSVNGQDLGFKEPVPGSIDTSCVLHSKDLILRHGFWKDRVEAGYAHDAEFFSRWTRAGEKWAATGKATLRYNAETCGQKDFILAKAAAAAQAH